MNFFELWHQVNVEFRAGRLPGLIAQARPARKARNRNPLHPLSCRCPTCRSERTEARMRTRDWILSVQREARAKEFSARCDWIKGIMDGHRGESVLDRGE